MIDTFLDLLLRLWLGSAVWSTIFIGFFFFFFLPLAFIGGSEILFLASGSSSIESSLILPALDLPCTGIFSLDWTEVCLSVRAGFLPICDEEALPSATTMSYYSWQTSDHVWFWETLNASQSISNMLRTNFVPRIGCTSSADSSTGSTSNL